MNKATVVSALNTVREARKKWDIARAKYAADETALMRRLALEGAANYMSPEDIAAESGLTLRGVRLMLRADGLDPRRSKTVLSKHAARTLADNAALMGIEPKDMDLTSPLAYLPMGSNLRQVLGASVTAEDIEAEPLATGNWCVRCEYFEEPHHLVSGDCNSCGCNEVEHVSVKVVPA